MKRTLKLVRRRFPMLKKGDRIGWETVGSSIIGGWDKMTDAQKKQFKKQYDYEWKNLDSIYNARYNFTEDDIKKAAEAHKTRMQDEFNIIKYKKAENSDTIDNDLKRLYGDATMRKDMGLALPDTYYSNQYKNRYISEYSTPRFNAEEDWNKRFVNEPLEVQELYSMLPINPIDEIWQEKVKVNFADEGKPEDVREVANTSNRVIYKNNVKRPNNKYYNSLIKKINAKYGTQFRDMYDIAAFQDRFGAKRIDGIIGPETEAMLDHYFKMTEYKPINTRRMYRKQDNKSVYDTTEEAYKQKRSAK